MCRRGVELGNLGFQVLVDQQQRLQRAAEVPIAIRHDFIDGGLIRSKTHPKPLPCPWVAGDADPSLVCDADKIDQRQPVVVCAQDPEKVLTMVIKWPTTPL